MTSRLAEAIKNTAAGLGVSAEDLATVISYETGGTFDEWKAGPTTQYGQHRGLIQWGEPQRQQYGVYKGMDVEAQMAAVGQYLKSAGVQPGMSLLDIYSAVNAGKVGRYNASDASNGGAPGTVYDKVTQQMEGHKAKAAALLGGTYSPAVRAPYADEGQDRATIDYGIYDQTAAPTPLTVPQRVAAEAAAPQPYGFGQAMAESAQSDWYTAHLIRYMSEGAVDVNYMGPSAEDWQSIVKTVPEKYHDYLLSAGSESAFQQRLKFAQEDTTRDERFAASGLSGVAARLLTSVADPITIPVAALTGGAGLSILRGAGLAARVGG